jgi:hypothetical protein
MFSPYQLPSDCKNYPPERAVLYEVAQSFSRFSQREGLSHDRFDRAGFKQRGSRFPRVSNDRLRLREHIETPDAGLRHDEICHVNSCFAACGIPECYEGSSQRERFDRLAQNFTTDPVELIGSLTVSEQTMWIIDIIHIQD